MPWITGEYIVNIPIICHSTENLTVNGNPLKSNIINQIKFLALGKFITTPDNSTTFRVCVFFCIMSTSKNIRVDNKPCTMINKIKL